MSAFQDLLIPAPIDSTVPRWVRENDYPERHQEMLDDLYRVSYWREACQLAASDGQRKPDGMLPEQWLDVVLAGCPNDRELILDRVRSAAACTVAVMADSLKADGEEISRDFAKAVDNVVKVVGDPKVPQAGPTGVTRTLFAMAGSTPKVEQVEGYIGLLSGEKVLVFFVVPAGWQRAVEKDLQSLVKFDSIDPEIGYRELDARPHPKTRKGADGAE